MKKPSEKTVTLASTILESDVTVMVFDRDSKSLKTVEGICLNGDAIQLNVETWEKEAKNDSSKL